MIVSTLLAEQVQATETQYCVIDVPVTRRQVTGVSGSFSGPESYLYNNALPTPVAYSQVEMPVKQGGYSMQKLYWKFTSDRRLEGPYQYRERLNEVGHVGDTTYFSGVLAPWNFSNSKRAAAVSKKFFAATNGELPQLLSAPPNRADWVITDVRLAVDEGGIKVRYLRDVPNLKQELEYYIIRKDGFSRTSPDEVRHIFRPLAGSDLMVLTDRDLSFSDAGGNILKLRLRLNQEYGPNWESVNIDRYGWIFAEGDGNDYAIKLNTKGDKIALEKLYHYTGHGWLARFFQWLTIDDYTLADWRFHGSQRVDFSPTLQLTIFGSPSQVLRYGLLEDIGHGQIDRYLGDASGLKAALFRGSKGELFAYDGEELQQLVGPGERHVNTHEHMPKSYRDKMPDEVSWYERWELKTVPEIGRTFVFIDNMPFELMGRIPKLRLSPLPLVSYLGKVESDRNLGPLFIQPHFIRFPSSQNILVFGTRGIFQYTPTEQIPVWQMNAATAFMTNPEAIDFSSIVSVDIWNGIMYRTKDKRFHLVRRC